MKKISLLIFLFCLNYSAISKMQYVDLYNNGVRACKANELSESLEYFQQVIVSSDSLLTSKSYYNMGFIKFKQQNYEQAISAFRNALLFNPNDDNARYNLILSQNRFNDSPSQVRNQIDSTQKESNNISINSTNTEPHSRINQLTKKKAEIILQAYQERENKINNYIKSIENTRDRTPAKRSKNW